MPSTPPGVQATQTWPKGRPRRGAARPLPIAETAIAIAEMAIRAPASRSSAERPTSAKREPITAPATVKPASSTGSHGRPATHPSAWASAEATKPLRTQQDRPVAAGDGKRKAQIVLEQAAEHNIQNDGRE